MNKQNFTQIVKNYGHITADDRNKLQEIASDFPYSQIIHTLIAKANVDAKTPIANQTLGYAAMYSTDRAVLKKIITSDTTSAQKKVVAKTTPPPAKQPEIVSKPVEKIRPSDEKQPKIKKGKSITVNRDLITQDDFPLRETIMHDLMALKESKASYMAWVNLPDDNNAKKSTESSKLKKKTTAKPTKKTKKAVSNAPVKEKKEATTKKPAKKAIAKSKTKASAAKASTKKTTKKSADANKKSSSKKGNTIDQSIIIDNFISKEPSITSKASRKSQANQEDLSQTSTEFTEDLMSENLAKIMISQGKTNKAIDIYKKLIWKFPQKKAYFATQIEELKK